MGHSVASLYRKTSMGCPLTKGSWGKRISRGIISVVEPFRDVPPKTAASAFPLGLNGELVRGGLADTGDPRAEPALERLCSEAAERVRPPMGTVRLLRFWTDAAGESDDESGRGISSSGGVWSAGGMGRPRAAAIIWGSVHWSSTSFKPRQNGAILRSI